MSAKSGTIRRREKGFAQVSNIALRDKKLSLKAKGLYALIESYLTIDNWILYKNFLKQQCKERETAFESTWKELKDNGYLIQYRLQEETTKQFYYEYELLDTPDIAMSTEVHNSQNRKKKEEKNHTPENQGMDNTCNGKGGVYNKTDLSDTNLNNTDREIREGKPSSADLSALVPVECISDLDKYFIGRFKKERCFYNCDFSIGLYYNAFADALVKTQIQDSIEILTMKQYPYFISTLKKMIEPLEIEKKLLGWVD